MPEAKKPPGPPALMIAGPGELHDVDLEVLGGQVTAHYGDAWVEQHSKVVGLLGEFLGAADTPYVIPGTGTTCLDAAFFNLFEPGQKVVVANTGFFGVRLMEMARQHRLEVQEVSIETGAPIDPDVIRAAANGADGVLS